MSESWQALPLFWRFQLIGWTAFLILTLPAKLAVSDSLTLALGSFVVRDGFSFLLTLAMKEVYDRIYQRHKEPRWIIGSIAIVSMTAGALQLPVFYLAGEIFPFEEKTLFDRAIPLGIFYYRTGLFTCWSLLYFGIRQMRDGMKRELRLTLIESEKRNAQLQMLRAQMNPHFLFNALNAIQVEIGKTGVALKETVRALAEYLRFAFDHGNDELIPMGLEYDSMLAYLKVEKLRFREDLVFECRIDEAARNAAVPGIILQPLVENAIQYGQQTSELPLQIWVNITRTHQGGLKISVTNTGQWVEAGEIAHERSSHIGLGNVRRRLGLLYAAAHRLVVENTSEKVTIEIEIPITN